MTPMTTRTTRPMTTDWRRAGPLPGELAGLLSLMAVDLQRSMSDRPQPATQWTPCLNLRETPEAYLIECELPGCCPEDVKVTVMGDMLTICGERRCPDPREQEQWHLRECATGTFQRTVMLPCAMEEKGIMAECCDGMLMVCVRKAARTPSRQIEVCAARRS